MNKIIITVGLPASSKSSWAKELQKKEPGKWKVVNKDSLRNMIDDGVWSNENEEFVNNIQEQIIKAALRKNMNVVKDDTNLSPRIYKRICQLAAEIGDITVETKIFDLDVETCIERDSKREGRAKVGEKVIRDMYDRYKLKYGYPQPKTDYFPPKKKIDIVKTEHKEFVVDEKRRMAIICDLDGTLAIIGDRSPFDASKCDELDYPNVPVVETVRLYYKAGYQILFVSGREDKFKIPTQRFISKCLPEMPYELFMRKTKDFRGDDVVKEEIYINEIMDKWQVLMVLDDRGKVILKWRELGLTCFQVAEGDF